MTKKQIKDLVAHLEKNPKTAMIDGETAVKAMKAVTKEADKRNIPWALVGGVAMSYYGSPRLTKTSTSSLREYLALMPNGSWDLAAKGIPPK